MAKALIKYETLDADQIKMIMAGKEPGEPKTWKDDPDFDDKNTKETQSKSNKGKSKGSMDSNDNLNNPINLGDFSSIFKCTLNLLKKL